MKRAKKSPPKKSPPKPTAAAAPKKPTVLLYRGPKAKVLHYCEAAPSSAISPPAPVPQGRTPAPDTLGLIDEQRVTVQRVGRLVSAFLRDLQHNRGILRNEPKKSAGGKFWTRGILPGMLYIKSSATGEIVRITREEWERLS